MKPLLSVPAISTEYARRYGSQLIKGIPQRAETALAGVISPAKSVREFGDSVDYLARAGAKHYQAGTLGKVAKQKLAAVVSNPETAANMTLDLGAAIATRKPKVFQNTNADEIALTGMGAMTAKSAVENSSKATSWVPGAELKSAVEANKKLARDSVSGLVASAQTPARNASKRQSQVATASLASPYKRTVSRPRSLQQITELSKK